MSDEAAERMVALVQSIQKERHTHEAFDALNDALLQLVESRDGWRAAYEAKEAEAERLRVRIGEMKQALSIEHSRGDADTKALCMRLPLVLDGAS